LPLAKYYKVSVFSDHTPVRPYRSNKGVCKAFVFNSPLRAGVREHALKFKRQNFTVKSKRVEGVTLLGFCSGIIVYKRMLFKKNGGVNNETL
jgi:hypothetical protein